MAGKHWRVKDVARLTAVTVRTLHHYDEIGLLRPSGHSRTGHRLYDDDDLVRLHQILVYRELGLPLEAIKRLMLDPTFDRRAALEEQRRRLLERAGRTEAMIRAVDAALRTMEGATQMDPKQMFDGFDPTKYEQEAKERWGHTEAYRESAKRTARYSADDWARIKGNSDAIMRDVARLAQAGVPPTDPAAMDLAEAHRSEIDRWFYPCSYAMHEGLAQMYVSDARFTASLDAYGEGVAAYLAAAIAANAARQP